MTGRVLAVVLTLVAASSRPVAAEPAPAAESPPPPDGRSDRAREEHAAAIAIGGSVYLSVEIGFNAELAPTQCRWCNPPSIDASAYHHLLWDHPKTASDISTLTGYVVAPALLFTLVGFDSDDTSWRRIYDDVTPMVESAIAAGLVQHVAKYSVGRQRPFAHFGSESDAPTSHDNNLSFYSGHATLDLALVTSAGTVARKRHSAMAPWIWGGGMTLAVVTGYLRVAAGAHYLTDVLAGAAVGTGIGLTVPLLVSSDVWRAASAEHGAMIVPTLGEHSGSLSLVGAF